MNSVPWMREGPFGLMVHWVRGTMPRAGVWESDWNRACDAFDVERFVRQVERSGARWVIFPFGHISGGGFYCSPNAHLESIAPGRCSRRDLMKEIADALHRRGIRLVAYLHAEVDCGGFDAALREGMEWDADPVDKSKYQSHLMAVVREWSLRLGRLLSGWWFDGCYDSSTKSFLRTHTWDNRRFDFPAWDAAIRAGNPDAIYAMNPGANTFEAVNPRHEGYLSGETNDLSFTPAGPHEDGLPWHALVWIDVPWVHDASPGPIPPPKYSADQLAAYARAWRRWGGGVTFNVGIYQDGTIAEASVDRLAETAGLLAEDEGP